MGRGSKGGEMDERQCNLREGGGSQPRSGESFGFHHAKTPVDDFSHQGAMGFTRGVIVEGVLDKGVSGQLDYMLCPDCWTMKIQD